MLHIFPNFVTRKKKWIYGYGFCLLDFRQNLNALRLVIIYTSQIIHIFKVSERGKKDWIIY